MPQPKRVFVTGATGFLGSHLAFHFLEQGHHVSVLARSSKSAAARQRAKRRCEPSPDPTQPPTRFLNDSTFSRANLAAWF